MAWIERLHARDGADDFGQAAGMEQLAVQRVRAAVVAQVEADHRHAALVEELRERQQVERVRAALPAVQQDREAGRARRRIRRRTRRASP